jgi:hypothetical protein
VFVLPIAAAIVATFFAVATWRAAHGRGPLRVWAFALAQFAIASFALAWGVGVGWSPWLYRAFYLFGAVLNVAWLGLGTVRLFVGKYWELFATAAVLLLSACATYAIVSTPFVSGAAHVLRTTTLPAPKSIVPPGTRIWARFFSIGGSVVVLLGLAWSLARRRRQALGLGLLTIGVVVTGVAGELARVGLVAWFSGLLAGGIVLMYAGFVRTRTT